MHWNKTKQEFTLAKIIWLSIYHRNFVSYITIHPPVHPSIRPYHRRTKVKCHFLASVGAYNVIIAHPCCGQLTAVKIGYLLTKVTWLNSEWISLQRLQVFV